MRRRTRGDETTSRLLNWSDSQKAAERLAGHLLAAEGFASIDPAHPLGGPDGLKDLVCSRNGKRWVAAAYFPNGKKAFSAVQRKFNQDIQGAKQNDTQAFVFVTNQYLTQSERERLISTGSALEMEILHLERIARILDSSPNYGTRLEFLDIEMTKEEQVAFFSSVALVVNGLHQQLTSLLDLLTAPAFKERIPAEELAHFQKALYSLIGYPGALSFFSPMERLRPPLAELEMYAAKLRELTGGPLVVFNPMDRLRPPLLELEEYGRCLRELTTSGSGSVLDSPVGGLRPPTRALKEYEQILDSILKKLHLALDLERRLDTRGDG